MCACVYECVITHVMSAIKQNCLTVRAVSQEDCVLEVCVHCKGTMPCYNQAVWTRADLEWVECCLQE